MKKINNPVFIEYETKSREFDGKLLLITHLLNSGFSKVFFGASIPLRNEAISYTNGIYFFKSVWKSEEKLYIRLKERGFILVLIHAEGGIYYKDNNSSIESAFNREMLKYFDYNFVYGKTIKEDIERIHGSQFSSKTIVAGEPRFDLLKPAYASFFKNEIDRIKNTYNKFILINTSFSLANPHEGYINLKDYFLNNPTFSDEAKKLYLLKMDFFPKVVEEFINAINKLAVSFPDIFFIVRPHPSESEEFYKKKFDGINNIIITNKGNVVPWILASLGIIHYDCTTGIEALLAKKPVISYVPIINNKVVAWLPIEASKKVTALNELKDEVKNILRGNFSDNTDNTTKNILYSTINNFVSESTPIITKSLFFNASNLGKSVEKRKYNKYWIKFVDYNIKIIAKSVLRKKDISSSKFGKTSKNEIRNKIVSIQMIRDFGDKIQIKRHTINSFIILKKQ